MPHLVVISGAPASGKTTISRRLETDLAIPLIAKDDIKELLFDRLPQHDRGWSTIQGRMAITMMYAGARELLQAGYHVMVESSFNRDFSVDEINRLVQETGADIVEVHCRLSHELRQQRWTKRTESGHRHPGHQDDPRHTLSLRPNDAPLYPAIADIVDTGAEPGEYERRYKEVISLLQEKLGTGGRYETTN